MEHSGISGLHREQQQPRGNRHHRGAEAEQQPESKDAGYEKNTRLAQRGTADKMQRKGKDGRKLRNEDLARQHAPIRIMRAQVLDARGQVGEQEQAQGNPKNGQ